jgi:hypothetical protein
MKKLFYMWYTKLRFQQISQTSCISRLNLLLFLYNIIRFFDRRTRRNLLTYLSDYDFSADISRHIRLSEDIPDSGPVKSLIERLDDPDEFYIWADNCFSLFFEKIFAVFFELFLYNLNDIFINFLDDSLFLKRVSEVVDRVDCDVLEISIKFSFTDEDLNCSYFFLRFFNHSAKFVISRVTVRIAVLKNFWFNAQSVRARFFSLICLKNRIMFRRSWWLAEDNLIIVEKFRLLFTNSRRKCVCRMMWSLRDKCFEVRLINRELFTTR